MPATVSQLHRAVQSARDAFAAWRRTDHETRRAHLERYAERLAAHREEIALCIAREVGKPLWEARIEADAMAGKVGLSRLASVIHPYPTQAEAIRQIGDAYRRTRLTPLVARVLRAFLALTR